MQLKREILARYYTPDWVAKKSDAQVHVIYMRLLNQGKLNHVA